MDHGLRPKLLAREIRIYNTYIIQTVYDVQLFSLVLLTIVVTMYLLFTGLNIFFKLTLLV